MEGRDLLLQPVDPQALELVELHPLQVFAQLGARKVLQRSVDELLGVNAEGEAGLKGPGAIGPLLRVGGCGRENEWRRESARA